MLLELGPFRGRPLFPLPPPEARGTPIPIADLRGICDRISPITDSGGIHSTIFPRADPGS